MSLRRICNKGALNRMQQRSAIFFAALTMSLFSSAHADTTTLAANGTSKVSSNNPVTMLFPITRSGYTGYDVVLSYHTINGSGTSPLDYLGTADKIVIPAGSASAEIPVSIPAYPYNGPDRTFQLQLDAATGVGPALSFADPQAFFAGNHPYFSTIADINGDGKPDLIVTAGPSTVSVLLNTTLPGSGMPSFAAAVSFPVGLGLESVTAADINGDGKPDLVVSNLYDQTISVLLNTTPPGAMTPSFSAQQLVSVGFQVFSVIAADINGDGKPDLVVQDYFGNSGISVLLNTTAPGAMISSFAAQQSFAVGSHPNSVTAADLNGDGKVDLIAANTGDGTISVLLNTTVPGVGVASFAAQQAFIAENPMMTAVADINGDGKPDLIVGGSSAVTLLMSSTAPGAMTMSYNDPQYIAAGPAPEFLVAADANGDGKPDLLVADYDNAVSVLRNITEPGASMAAFSAPITIGITPLSQSISATDLNGDGKPDLLLSGASPNNVDDSNSVLVLLNTTAPDTSTSSFASPAPFAVDMNSYSTTTADINGDGKPDLIVANTLGTVSVLLNTTVAGAVTPSSSPEQRFATAFGTGAIPYSVCSADINGDGRPDIIVVNTSSPNGSVSVLLNTTLPGATTLSFAAQQAFATGSSPYWVSAIDVNGDGKADLIVANGGSNTVSVLLNTTAPGASTPSFATQQTFATGTNPVYATAADINGDGKPDLIVTNVSANTVSVLLNTTAPGAITPSFAPQQSFGTGSGPVSAAVVDLNGDGKPDLIVANGMDVTVSVLLNTTAAGAATPSFASQQSFTAGGHPNSVVVTDINGDGRPDLITANEGNTASLLLNVTTPGSTSPNFIAATNFAASTNYLAAQSIAITDINGDGKPDLVLAGFFTGSVSVLLNTQYKTVLAYPLATGTIVHDYLFANGFE